MDETLSAGDDRFEDDSRATERKFESCPRNLERITFAGIQITKTSDGFTMSQKLYATNIFPLQTFCDFE